MDIGQSVVDYWRIYWRFMYVHRNDLSCEYTSVRPPEKLFQFYINNKLNHMKHMLAMSISTIMAWDHSFFLLTSRDKTLYGFLVSSEISNFWKSMMACPNIYLLFEIQVFCWAKWMAAGTKWNWVLDIFKIQKWMWQTELKK